MPVCWGIACYSHIKYKSRPYGAWVWVWVWVPSAAMLKVDRTALQQYATRAHTHKRTHTHAHTHMCKQPQASTHTLCVHACSSTYHPQPCAYNHMYAHTHTHTHLHTHTHTHTHTHATHTCYTHMLHTHTHTHTHTHCLQYAQGATVPGVDRTALQLDFNALNNGDTWVALITFLYLDFLDATSTMFAMAHLVGDEVRPRAWGCPAKSSCIHCGRRSVCQWGFLRCRLHE
jgi:hypothetical protein